MDLNFKILGAGEPIVILHGLFGMLDNWQTVAKELSEDYMVILVDLRNHGKSPHSEEWDINTMAHDIIELLHKNWIYHAVILGHSMGGKVAMKIAMEDKDLVRGLIVVDISPKTYERGHDNIIDALKFLPIEEISSRNEAEELLATKIKDWGIRQFLLKNLTRSKNNGFHWKMNLPVIADKYYEILKELKGQQPFLRKTLFIAGADSDYILKEDEPLIYKWFPNATVTWIEGAGHWVHAQKKDEFVVLVNQFMKSLTD